MGVPASSYQMAEPTGRTGRRPRVRLPVVAARSGDHSAIHYFLSGIFQAPSRAEFRASLDDPFYEPSDRLLLKRGDRIVGHALITHRVQQFGPLEIPVANLSWLASAPELQGQGLGRHLLAAAERQMAEGGAMVGWLRTRIPHFFRRQGWALCGRYSYSQAGARSLLSQLLAQGLRRRLHIRPWRRWEESALVRIYNQNRHAAYGMLERSEHYWRWLVRRRAYDQIYVAIDGPELPDLDQAAARIVAYAFTRGQHIVELMTARGHRRAASEMIARACDDAVEQDRQAVVLHAPASDPFHNLFTAAGGLHYHRESDHGEVYMARLLEPLRLLRRLGGEFHRRAREAGLPRPLEFGLLVDGKKYQLELTAEETRAVSRTIGRSYLRLNVADFTRLVLGQLDWPRALADGRVEPSTGLARDAGQVLFPTLPLWRPPLDDLQTV